MSNLNKDEFAKSDQPDHEFPQFPHVTPAPAKSDPPTPAPVPQKKPDAPHKQYGN
jgi:hypothetical protein